jgi:hypothetical protein
MAPWPLSDRDCPKELLHTAAQQGVASGNSLYITFKSMPNSRALVAHAYNPSYSGGRDQEDHGSKPAWANSS